MAPVVDMKLIRHVNDSHQFPKIRHRQFAVDARSSRFNGASGHLKAGSDLLGEESLDKQFEHETLFLIELAEPHLHITLMPPLVAAMSIEIDRGGDCLLDSSSCEGLHQEVQRPEFHGLHSQWDFRKAGDHDHRQCVRQFTKFCLDLQAIKIWQLQIEQYASRILDVKAIQKGLAVGESDRLKSYRANQRLQCAPHIRVVIDHEDCRLEF